MAFSRPLNTSELVATSKKTYCRFCGKMSVARSFVNLQSNEDDYMSTLTKLAYMNIKPARKLHMNVCQPCHESFKKAHHFCQKFNHTQAYLANVYGSEQKAAAEKAKAPAKRALEVKEEPQSENEIDVDDVDILDMAVPVYNKKKKQFVEHGKTWSSYTWICCYCDFESNKLSELRAHAASVKHCHCFAFECPDCDIKLNEYEDFIEHVRLHKENLRFFCDVCDKGIPINSRHDHASGRHQCECCGLILSTAISLRKHKKEFQKRPIIAKESNPGYYIITVPNLQLEGAFPRCDIFQSWDDYVWACSECDMKFHSVSAIRGHSSDVHNGCFTIKCIDCNETIDEFHKLIQHITSHRPSLRHFCPFCNRLAKTDAGFRVHVRTHLTNISYCLECGPVRSIRPAEEEPRSLTSTVEPVQPVPENGDVEETSVSDILHTFENLSRTVDPIQADYALPSPKICDFCQEVFKDKRLFREHTKTRYCLICKKDYSCSKNIEQHMFNVHMSLKPFECYQCGRCYGKKSKAYDCMQNHLTEEMGDCMVCESKVLKSFLTEHTEAHRYEVLHKQTICGVGLCRQKFTSWVELVKHRHSKHLTITFRKVRHNGRYMAQQNIGLLPQDEDTATDTATATDTQDEDTASATRGQSGNIN